MDLPRLAVNIVGVWNYFESYHLLRTTEAATLLNLELMNFELLGKNAGLGGRKQQSVIHQWLKLKHLLH